MKIYQTSQKHWVGNGFYVSNLLPGYEQNMNSDSLPFLMIDYQSPKYFAPTTQKLGVGTHPHKGFETLTIVYSGEIEHRDSHKNGGIIKAGEAQWMTTGKGIAHSEFYTSEFLAQGGIAEFVQIWIKLPATYELTEPKYQTITQTHIGQIIANNVSIRLLAGKYGEVSSSTHTFSPIIVADMIWGSADTHTLDIPMGYQSYLLVRKGEIEIEGQCVTPGCLIEINKRDTMRSIYGSKDTEILLLSGLSWNDPIYHYGPFVLHDQKELYHTLYGERRNT